MSKMDRGDSAARDLNQLARNRISRRAALGMLTATAGAAAFGSVKGPKAAKADPIPGLDARVVAIGIPGASAVAQVGVFLTTSPCGSPIPSKFPSSITAGAVLDPKRILVGSASNFGAALTANGGHEGSVLSLDPTGSSVLLVPFGFASSGNQASALGGFVQMFSANSPHWLNGVNTPSARPRPCTRASAIRSAFPTTTPLGASGRPIRRSGRAGLAPPASSTRPVCRWPAPPAR